MVLFQIFETIATNCVSKKRKFYIYLVFINHDKQILQCIEKKLKFCFHPLKQHFLTHHPPKAKNFFHPLFLPLWRNFFTLKIFRNFSKILIFLTLSPTKTRNLMHHQPKAENFFSRIYPPRKSHNSRNFHSAP